MTIKAKNHLRVVAFALAGLVLVVMGLSFTALSNPKRFPNNARYDQYIDLLATSGTACTLVGVLVFLVAIRNATTSIPSRLAYSANFGIGLGIFLQAWGFFGNLAIENRLALFVAGFLAFAWGGVHYAQGKRYSSSVGLLGILGIPGIIALVLLPNREPESETNSDG